MPEEPPLVNSGGTQEGSFSIRLPGVPDRALNQGIRRLHSGEP
jgi:hypothetical protein